ncbi:ANTAR domain-containing protein [Methylophilus rhizosphaerae]|uniref:ANTAR domain-containing protein n=1 Tax=Methylophilus rhizosphaerae TaxID=492660 RepID=A0A1G9BQ96_9PROT|nr:nitrate regulatory protein [Methylophilus rhizosphaerae]SDK41681.1 ANTAR domain-containing protein [Methylophilus rhizosphaerae]
MMTTEMTTEISPEHTIILAKIRHIEELKRLGTCIEFVENIAQMVHQIQTERGASCLYLASAGQRFSLERAEIIKQNLALETRFRQALQQHLAHNALADARQLTLISWSLLGFDQLKSLRHQITLQKISFSACIESFSRLVGSLIALIFEITDSPVNSQLSTCLLTLYNLVQGKEFAGQERAVGSYLFGSGSLQLAHQQKLLELAAQQERHFTLFCQFGGEDIRTSWSALQASDSYRQHQQYRDRLAAAKDQQVLKQSDADIWFELCSQQQTSLWHIQCQLIQKMRNMLEVLADKARHGLEHTQAYLQAITAKPSSAALDSTFFNLAIPVESALSFHAHDTAQAYPMASMITLLQQQSRQIAEMESELSDTKKALTERKQIERAKGLLMNQLGIDEMEAYKTLRNTAMAQNRKIIDVAENILAQQKQPS